VANPFGDGKDFALHQSPRFIIWIGEEKRSETACEIEHDADAARAHAIDDFFEQERIAAALAGGGIMNMDVNDACAGLGGFTHEAAIRAAVAGIAGYLGLNGAFPVTA
jgi:hypothetical protein